MDIRKIGKFNHASLIVVGSVVPVNRQFQVAAGCPLAIIRLGAHGVDRTTKGWP